MRDLNCFPSRPKLSPALNRRRVGEDACEEIEGKKRSAGWDATGQTQVMKDLGPVSIRRQSLFLLAVKGLLALAVLFAVPVCFAQATTLKTEEVRPVLAVFGDRPITDAQWSGLQAALRHELDAHPEVAAIDRDRVLILRDTQIRPGIVVESSVTVRLHGQCSLMPRFHEPVGAWPSSSYSAHISDPGMAPDRPLGWVLRKDGKIEPYIQVDCDRLAELLAPSAVGRNRDDRDRILSAAIARVILHEWIHIANQSRAHTRQGIERSTYGTADLLPSPDPVSDIKPAR
jgi:hypothetical protein